MQYQRILVTGGAGFIGSHLTDYLIEKGYKVRILDNLHLQIHPGGKLPAYLNKQAEFVKGDVTRRKDWIKALQGIDAVVHFAAAVGVGQSMYQVERYVRDNCLGTAIFLDILANEKHTVKKMLVAGSMSSFGEGMYRCPKCSLVQQPDQRSSQDLQKGILDPLCVKCRTPLNPIPTNESSLLKSPSVYAITKKNQEELVLSIGRAYRIPAVSLRFFNVYGSRQSLSNPYTGVTAIFFSRAKNNKPPIINEDGLQTRDFIHVSDIVRACEMTLINDKANYEIFNVGSGTPTTIREVAEVVLKLYGRSIKPDITGKLRASDVRHCFADVTKIKKYIGWKPTVDFENGMKDIYKWSKQEQAIDLVDEALAELEARGLR